MNTNQQIAKIDGWENIHTGGMHNSGLRGYKRTGGSMAFKGDIPDYLALESLHELMRICLENGLEIKIRAHKHRGMAGARNITTGGPRKFIEFHDPTVEKISTALAKAIVEVKG